MFQQMPAGRLIRVGDRLAHDAERHEHDEEDDDEVQ